jgi:hypothetical protein
MPTLTQLFDQHGSDKGSVDEAHLYSEDYERLIPPTTPSLLEIGIGSAMFNGRCGSIRAWLEWLPEGRVYGMDFLPAAPDLMRHPRFQLVRGDQGVRADLERLTRTIPPCAVIIDDGSHWGPHQRLTLEVLWDHLLPGGLYVIEDLYLRWGPPPHLMDELPLDPRFLCTIGRRDSSVSGWLVGEPGAATYVHGPHVAPFRGVALRKS